MRSKGCLGDGVVTFCGGLLSCIHHGVDQPKEWQHARTWQPRGGEPAALDDALHDDAVGRAERAPEQLQCGTVALQSVTHSMTLCVTLPHGSAAAVIKVDAFTVQLSA